MKICLQKPENHSEICLLTKKHSAFFSDGGLQKTNGNQTVDWLHLIKQGEEQSFPEPVLFTWKTDVLCSEKYKTYLILSKDKEFTNCKTIRCSGNSLLQNNFLLGQDYFWKVLITCGHETICHSEMYHFKTAFTPPRWIQAEGLSNIRDIGGWSVNGGRIRQGLVYRGCEMEFHHAITEGGKHVLLNELNIKTDLDLREEAVGKINCSALGKGVSFVLLPAKAYGEFLEEKTVCKKLFQLFCDQKNYPFYVHCWGGADRTGTLIFLLCAVLGMSEQDLFLDYELTSFSIWGERSRNSDLFRSLLDGLKRYGTEQDSINVKCTNFLLSTGITPEQINLFRKILIEKSCE